MRLSDGDPRLLRGEDIATATSPAVPLASAGGNACIPAAAGPGGMARPLQEAGGAPGGVFRDRRWREDAWRQLVASFDGVLRRYYGVYEFSSDPECVLRLAFGRAPRDVTLACGTRVASGEPVGVLHFWNEHLPPFPPEGPNLQWAKVMHRCLRRSLQALADHVRSEPAWRGIPAFYAEMRLSRGERTDTLLHVTQRFGFEVARPEFTTLDRCHALGEDLLRWGFTRAYNPAALRRRQLFGERREVWISRQSLLEHHLDGLSPAHPSDTTAD